MDDGRESEHGIGTRTVRGMAWAYGAYVGGRALVLVATAILAHLLSPSDFGVLALASTFMLFLEAIKDFGLGQALIVSSPEEEAARAQTVFGWSVLLGLTLTLLTAAASPLAAQFFHESQLKAVLPVIGLNFLLRALGATHLSLARKQLNYRVKTASEIAEVTVRGIVSITLALTGAGVWSLVIGFIAGAATSTIALWIQVPFRPKARLTRAYVRDLASFGGWLTLIDIGAVFAYNLDYIFIGRILGAYSLGLYTIGFRMPELMILNLANVAGDVLFPAYSALGRERMVEGFLVALRYTAMLVLPLTLGIVLLARPIILVLFGHKWTGSIDVMRVIAVYAFAIALVIPSGTVFKATKQAWISVIFTSIGLVVLVSLLLHFTKQGILAVALCTAGMQVISTPISGLIVSRRFNVPLGTIGRTLLPAIAAGTVMAAALAPVVIWLHKPLPALIVGFAAGAAGYLAGLWLVARKDVRRLFAMAFPGRFATVQS
jgi:O-antigen/teichoic acid export membrane protein